jgi:hypothetical protein
MKLGAIVQSDANVERSRPVNTLRCLVLEQYEAAPRLRPLMQYCLSEISFRVRHTLSRCPNGKQVLRVERYLRYCDFGSHHVLQVVPSECIMMT